MKPVPNSVVRFDCMEEEAKRHDRASGQRIRRRKGKANMENDNPDCVVHADRLHCKCTFGFFMKGSQQDLEELATASYAVGNPVPFQVHFPHDAMGSFLDLDQEELAFGQVPTTLCILVFVNAKAQTFDCRLFVAAATELGRGGCGVSYRK